LRCFVVLSFVHAGMLHDSQMSKTVVSSVVGG
jgi:hypothetical protein